jgi:hypothetical protein
MLKADPSKRRQLSASQPDLFWRDGPTGRTGLVVLLHACVSPDCPCREVELLVHPVGTWAEGISLTRKGLRYHTRAGSKLPDAADALMAILRADLDIDTGELRLSEGAHSNECDESVLAWLRDEMDGELLDHLADKMLRAKSLRPLDRLEVDDFEPDTMPVFDEVYQTGRIDAYSVGGRRLMVDDAYCVAPGCSCCAMRLIVLDEKRDLGSFMVPLDKNTWPTQVDIGSELEQVWAAFVRRYPTPRPFRQRAKLMKQAAPDIIANSRPAPKIAPPEIGRNQPCPCGSGKKYKRCCLAKDVALKF